MIVKKFPSSSQPDVEYTTTYDPETGVTTCECRGYRYSPTHNCVHIRAIKADPNSTTYTKVAPPLGFISPMLAGPLPKDIDFRGGEWIAEEKFDGHRLVTLVSAGGVQAWSRLGKLRELPPAVLEAVRELPYGTYDGELLAPGLHSYGTADHSNAGKLVYTIFDVVSLLGTVITPRIYEQRRAFLKEIFGSGLPFDSTVLQLAPSWEIHSWEDVYDRAQEIWDRGGEGLILKWNYSVYEVGRRSKHWLKVKQLQTAVMTITGFVEGLLGPQSIVSLADAEGNTTKVKTKNTEWLAKLGKEPARYIGKKLRIEFQERTADGSYRHPMWDRMEDE